MTLDEVKGLLDGSEGIVLNAIIAVEVIDAEGGHALLTGCTDDMTYWSREGMARTLLRDAVRVPQEFERREAVRLADELEGEVDE